HRRDGSLDEVPRCFCFAFAAREEHDVARLHDRAQPLRDAVLGHLGKVTVEEAGVIEPGLGRERLDPGARGEGGAGFVESNVPIGATPRICRSTPPASAIFASYPAQDSRMSL